MVVLAALAFVAIFFLAVPFPIIIIAAAFVGFLAQRFKLAEFQNSAAHTPGGTAKSDTAGSLLGEEPPPHARPAPQRAIAVAAIWLALWLIPVIALLLGRGSADIFSQIAVFFSKMAVVTFGGAYAVLAYVAQQAVETHGWLKPGEMLDGLGMAETTPGPLIMVLQFVGFMAAYRNPGSLASMLAGTFGGLLATWVTFTPCFLWIFLGAPFIERLRGNAGLNAAFSAITAAVVGVILNLAIWFAVHSIFHVTVPVHAFPLSFDAPVLTSVDPWALALTLAAAIVIFRFKAGMIATLGACCATGIVLYLLGAI
jgi:chromate transporter